MRELIFETIKVQVYKAVMVFTKKYWIKNT
jgi:hypothetical protein